MMMDDMTQHQILWASSEENATLKLVWITDLHLDAADKKLVRQFFEIVVQEQPDAILIGGDISNGINSLNHLKHLAKLIHKPFYFVLGNHDFYFGSIYDIREKTRWAAKEFSSAYYLTDESVISLTKEVALIGHDGWSDAREGDFLSSDVILHDYLLIDELKDLTKQDRMKVMNQLGDEAADALRRNLKLAFERHNKVIVLTHTPPFRESSLNDGNVCDDNWAPHFVCKAVGDMLRKVVAEHPEKEVLVLCGHSHESADRQILPNLRALTGRSQLGEPAVQGIIRV